MTVMAAATLVPATLILVVLFVLLELVFRHRAEESTSKGPDDAMAGLVSAVHTGSCEVSQ